MPGKQQEKWLQRAKAAGGKIVVHHSEVGSPEILLLVEGGKDIRIPVRMFESFLSRAWVRWVSYDGWFTDHYVLVDDIEG